MATPNISPWPWHFYPGRRDEFDSSVLDSEGSLVADTYEGPDAPDAHLIAAAPEIADAASKFLEAVRHSDLSWYPFQSAKSLEEALKKAGWR